MSSVFSALKRIKGVLISPMNDQKLNNVTIMNIEADIQGVPKKTKTIEITNNLIVRI